MNRRDILKAFAASLAVPLAALSETASVVMESAAYGWQHATVYVPVRFLKWDMEKQEMELVRLPAHPTRLYANFLFRYGPNSSGEPCLICSFNYRDAEERNG